jgi:hypothetical protein
VVRVQAVRERALSPLGKRGLPSKALGLLETALQMLLTCCQHLSGPERVRELPPHLDSIRPVPHQTPWCLSFCSLPEGKPSTKFPPTITVDSSLPAPLSYNSQLA